MKKKKTEESEGDILEPYVLASIIGVLSSNPSTSPKNIASLAVSIAIEVVEEMKIQLKNKK